jgi:hypothetical protein
MRQTLLILACTGLLCAGLVEARSCDVNGQQVNPDNGSTTAGKTGVLRCRRDDGSLWYEQMLRNGEHLGLDRFHDEDGSVREREVNANGNTEGMARQWYPGGQLQREGEYRDGNAVGTHRSFAAAGQQASLRVYPVAGKPAAFSVEWDEQGQVRALSCASSSQIDVDRALCGFDQAVSVDLYDGRGLRVERRLMDHGAIVRSEQFDPQGRLNSVIEIDSQGSRERRFFEDGQQASETLVREGYRVRHSEWYMNGAPRLVQTQEPRERDARAVIEGYRDTGVLEERETAIGGRRIQREVFDEAARLQEDWDYAPQGNPLRHRKFSANGEVILEEAFYPDGSRKPANVEAPIAIGG